MRTRRAASNPNPRSLTATGGLAANKQTGLTHEICLTSSGKKTSLLRHGSGPPSWTPREDVVGNDNRQQQSMPSQRSPARPRRRRHHLPTSAHGCSASNIGGAALELHGACGGLRKTRYAEAQPTRPNAPTEGTKTTIHAPSVSHCTSRGLEQIAIGYEPPPVRRRRRWGNESTPSGGQRNSRVRSHHGRHHVRTMLGDSFCLSTALMWTPTSLSRACAHAVRRVLYARCARCKSCARFSRARRCARFSRSVLLCCVACFEVRMGV